MAQIPLAASAATSSPAETGSSRSLIIVTMLFFMWGLLTSLNDVLIPHLKSIYTLELRPGHAGAVLLLRRLLHRLDSGRRADQAHRIPERRGDRPDHRGHWLRAVLSGGGQRLRAFPVCLLRTGRGHHDPAGGGESLRHRARRSQDRLQPPDADAGLQLAGHDSRAAVRRHPDPVGRSAGDRRRQPAVGGRTGGASRPGSRRGAGSLPDPGRRIAAARHRVRARAPAARSPTPTTPPCRSTTPDPVHLSPPEPDTRRRRDFPLRRRGGQHRQLPGQFLRREQHRRPAAGGRRQIRQLLLGRGDGGPLHRLRRDALRQSRARPWPSTRHVRWP